jgi:hypothetical protein
MTRSMNSRFKERIHADIIKERKKVSTWMWFVLLYSVLHNKTILNEEKRRTCTQLHLSYI